MSFDRNEDRSAPWSVHDPSAVPSSAPLVDRLARVVLRPVGSPLPLGFTALGGASVILSGLQLQWLPTSEAHQVGMVILVFAVPLQLLASVFGFLAHDSVGARDGGTGGRLVGHRHPDAYLASRLDQPDPGPLLSFVAAALMVPTSAASLGKVAAALVIFGAGARFALTAIYEFSRQHELGTRLRLVGARSVPGRPVRRYGLRGRRHPPAHDPAGGPSRSGTTSSDWGCRR